MSLKDSADIVTDLSCTTISVQGERDVAGHRRQEENYRPT